MSELSLQYKFVCRKLFALTNCYCSGKYVICRFCLSLKLIFNNNVYKICNDEDKEEELDFELMPINEYACEKLKRFFFLILVNSKTILCLH